VAGLAVAALALATAALGRGGGDAAPLAPDPTLVTVRTEGGLCPPGGDCSEMWTITADLAREKGGRLETRLDEAERRVLTAAIEQLDYEQIAKHPFVGMCPTATDVPERIYLFRGLEQELASCTYDLERVEAVRLVNVLIDRAWGLG
jgi:hypothetical protein